MRAKDLMSTPAVTVAPGTPAKAALAVLAAHGFTALPVVEGDRLVGLVTEADLLRGRVVADPRTPHGVPPEPGWTVGEVMRADTLRVAPGADVATAARVMLEHGVRSVPVADGDRLVGVLTYRDLLRVLARDDLDILADVRHRLAAYGGSGRWEVSVADGAVTVLDEHDDATDRHVARVLVESVPGVQAVRVSARPA
ncbi:HPP family protein [Actinokineospora soli]|uniref:HPP family protein n=1 Tax=Actinokineospora soli TaxID=1048753 RepID=A0ABW2TR74_9PSEU